MLVCVSLYSYIKDRRKIKQKSFDIIQNSRNDHEKACDIAGWVFNNVQNKTSDPFLFNIPILRHLGARPIDVLLKRAEFVAGSPLFICMLKSIHIQSGQVTLYHVTGGAQHALVEARLSGKSVLLDPAYGFYYTSQAGQPMGFNDIRTGEEPVFISLPGSREHGDSRNDYYHFDYGKTKTANWTMGPIRKLTYKVFWICTLGRIDKIFQPWWFEHPQLIICLGLLIVTLILVVYLSHKVRWDEVERQGC